jgi:amidophosphoribosyltransferase
LFADGDLVAVRDPFGFKPLVWGENSDFFAVASESIALEKIGFNKFYFVSPGGCMIFNKSGVNEKQLINSKRTARCHFEFTYFSKEGSVFDERPIHLTRKRAGENLAKTEPLKDEIKINPKKFIVIPVPRTSIPAAEAFADKLKIRHSSAILKSDSKRGFINEGKVRRRIMANTYFVIPEEVEGMEVFVIEDSVVRGETVQEIIRPLRKAGAKAIHLRSTEPPIKYPCFYGINFPTRKELIANKYSAQEFEKGFAKEIGADTVVFQTLEGLIDAIGFSENGLCLACLNGNYPTPDGRRLAKNSK